VSEKFTLIKWHNVKIGQVDTWRVDWAQRKQSIVIIGSEQKFFIIRIVNGEIGLNKLLYLRKNLNEQVYKIWCNFSYSSRYFPNTSVISSVDFLHQLTNELTSISFVKRFCRLGGIRGKPFSPASSNVMFFGRASPFST